MDTKRLSDYEKTITVMAIRYAVGRHSITSVSLAFDIAKNNADICAKDKEMISQNVLMSINDVLRFTTAEPSFSKDSLMDIAEDNEATYSNAIMDLIPWHNLAKFFKPSEYVVVTTDDNTETVCFKSVRYDHFNKKAVVGYYPVDSYIEDNGRVTMIESRIISVKKIDKS